MPRHLILYNDDVEDLLMELHDKLPYGIRKLKPKTRILAEDLSLLAVSSSGDAAVPDCFDIGHEQGESRGDEDEEHNIQIVVRHTFFDLAPANEDWPTVRSADTADF